VSFADQLAELLPQDLPNREVAIAKCARHLDLIVETNQQFNLTRILDEREAAIKHVLDSVIPWRWFAEAPQVFDIGTGAGFPGIPLAVVFPNIRFTLVESTGKKARFVEAAVLDLGLRNTSVMPRRAEEVLRARSNILVTARAVAPLSKALEWVGPAVRFGCRALLYKGPDADAEILKAAPGLRKHAAEARILEQYTLPDDLGSRTLVEVARRRPLPT
jgi:16S rRNA (guanine527-N7)-methyltransferase